MRAPFPSHRRRADHPVRGLESHPQGRAAFRHLGLIGKLNKRPLSIGALRLLSDRFWVNSLAIRNRRRSDRRLSSGLDEPAADHQMRSALA